MTEIKLMALMEKCQCECGSTESNNALVWTHPSYALFKRQYPDRLVKHEDIQWVDGGAVYNGYNADYDQLLVYGQANSTKICIQYHEKDIHWDYIVVLQAWDKIFRNCNKVSVAYEEKWA